MLFTINFTRSELYGAYSSILMVWSKKDAAIPDTDGMINQVLLNRVSHASREILLHHGFNLRYIRKIDDENYLYVVRVKNCSPEQALLIRMDTEFGHIQMSKAESQWVD